MIKVLDASALLIYLDGSHGCEVVTRAMETASERGEHVLMSAVNWGEVCYILIRRFGQVKAEQIIAVIDTLPIEIDPAGRETARQAAIYKAQHKLPYADSFAAALAKIRRAELLTADKEFHAVEKEIRILWV